jgi:hypothetical protein
MGEWLRRTVFFSGHEWLVKGSDTEVGPGPNRFRDEARSVWVDDAGQLHLQISRVDGVWQCAEVVSRESFGYGEYVFHLCGGADEINENAVLGLFTWENEGAFNHREIDIEVSRWGDPGNANGQYVIQPYGTPGNMHRFPMNLRGVGSSHRFEWRSDWVDFSSRSESGSMLARWRYTGPDVPPRGQEHARMNLWLFQRNPPSDGKEVEVVVRRFEFRPLAGTAP